MRLPIRPLRVFRVCRTVETCVNGKEALKLLRDKDKNFDLVLSDVYMPGTKHIPPTVSLSVSRGLLAHELIVEIISVMDADMDGFRLLEQVGLEMDLPVISKPHQILSCTLWSAGCNVVSPLNHAVPPQAISAAVQ